jgi:excinuclease ABC subunit C
MTSQELAKIGLPDAPGVYFFKAGRDILYIGRATSLRDRVRSYFANDLIHTRGVFLVDMVTQATSIDWTETGSVLEAIILETNLIKKHLPHFNTKEKDNRSFNYVAITDEAYPRVLLVRGRNLEKHNEKEAKDAAEKADSRVVAVDGTNEGLPYDVRAVFGPYVSPMILRDAMKIIRRIFPYRDTCTPPSEGGSGKPCFNCQLGRCPGVCTGEISSHDYLKTIRRISLFLSGKTETLLTSLERDMRAYAKQQRFEEANEMKKILYALSHIRDIALIKGEMPGAFTNSESSTFSGNRYRIESYDVAHLSGNDVVGVMTVVTNGMPDKAEYRKFRIRGVGKKGAKNDDVNNLKEILTRRFARTDWAVPDLIVVDGGIGQLNAARAVLAAAGAEIQSEDVQVEKIPIVSVVKDDRHAPREILGDPEMLERINGANATAAEKADGQDIRAAILLANHESHRFAIAYHKLLRKRAFINDKILKRT